MRQVVRLGAIAVLVGSSSSAWASNGLESPEASTAQIGRGGAWLARADDPLATYFNPAALATQASGAHLGAQLLIKKHCMDRRNAQGERVAPADGFNPPPDEVCADIDPFPNPQFGLALRVHERVGIGLAVLAPHTLGRIEWPATVEYANRAGFEVPHPSPTRYLLLKNEALGAFPTLGIGVAVTPQLQLGAGFVWGITALKVANMAEAVSTERNPGGPQPDDFRTDIRAELSGLDAFVPGFVVSALWSPHRRFDIAAWYRWSDAIKTRVDLLAETPFYTGQGQINETPAITDVKNAGSFELPIPMEAKIGFRYRHPREGARGQEWLAQHGDWARDSLTEDVFDLELDVTWSHNSAVDAVKIRLEPNIQIQGTTGIAPQNGDVPHEWKDVFGVRLGGEYVIIPDLFALRAGAFFESPGQAAEFLNIDFHQGWRLGGGGGLTVRLGRVDLSAAYQHTHFGKLDNGGQGVVKALSGDQTRPDGRSVQSVNGGSTTASLNEVALSAGVHW